MTDNEIKKALECCSEHDYLCPKGCPLDSEERDADCKALTKHALDLINRQQEEKETMQQYIDCLRAEIERLEKLTDAYFKVCIGMTKELIVDDKELEKIKSEAIKEFAEKIDQLFYRYAHLHSHADMARKDYIKADDGTEIEMQSVWDVFTLKKYGIAEYNEMNRLQTNIELIEKGRLLAELKKDFRLLVKEMTESPTKIEHSSLCETDTYEVKE